MVFKRRLVGDPRLRESEKEAQRVLNLLEAYGDLYEKSEIKSELKPYLQTLRTVVLQLFIIPNDYETTQAALFLLWDGYEFLTSGMGKERPIIPFHDNYLKKIKNMEFARCYNCLYQFRKADLVCPKCNTSIQWLLP